MIYGAGDAGRQLLNALISGENTRSSPLLMTIRPCRAEVDTIKIDRRMILAISNSGIMSTRCDRGPEYRVAATPADHFSGQIPCAPASFPFGG